LWQHFGKIAAAQTVQFAQNDKKNNKNRSRTPCAERFLVLSRSHFSVAEGNKDVKNIIQRHQAEPTRCSRPLLSAFAKPTLQTPFQPLIKPSVARIGRYR
jgi:hypothetical protein